MSDDRKLSSLPLAGTLSGSDLLLVVNEGVSRRVPLSGVVGFFVDGLASTAQLNSKLTELETSISASLAQKQGLDSDLTAIAGLSTANFGRSLLTMASAGATKAALAITSGDVADFAGAADGRIAAQKGAPSGLAPLDAGGKLGSAHLPAQVVSAFNTRSGAVTLTAGDVTTALGFTPAGLNAPAFTTPNLGAASAASLTLGAAGGGAKITLSGAASNWIEWSTAGVGAPTYTTRSAGTKAVLYPTLTSAQADYAIGVEGGYSWSSVPGPNAASQGWKWYGGTVEAARLTANGVFKTIEVQAMNANFSANDHYFGDGNGSGRLNLRKLNQPNDTSINFFTGAELRWVVGEAGSSVSNTGEFFIHRWGLGPCLSIAPGNGRTKLHRDVEIAGILNPTGGGVYFPQAQVASSDPNALDDYREATWTPHITFGGSSAGNVYLHQIGTYTKIGRMVYASAYIVLATKGSGTGEAAIATLPFSNAGRGVASIGVRLNPDLPSLWGNCGQGGPTVPIYSGVNPTTHASFANGCEINMTFVYSV